MKKKLVLVIIVAILGIILFLENVCKISVFDSVKQIVIGQSQMTDNGDNIENEFTVIDVTNLTDNGSIQHEHILKTAYNENEHWSECTTCGEKINIKAHTYTTKWASGVESCEKNNYYTKTCICGYSFTGHKPCVWDEKTYSVDTNYTHIRKCSKCLGQIFYSYKKKADIDKKGEQLATVYSAEYTSNVHSINRFAQKCTSTINGTFLTCDNLGTCSVCKANRNSSIHRLVVNDNNEIYCEVCNNKYGTYVQQIEEISNVPTKYKFTDLINLNNGAKFNATVGVRNVGNPLSTNSMSVSNKNSARYIIYFKQYSNF